MILHNMYLTARFKSTLGMDGLTPERWKTAQRAHIVSLEMTAVFCVLEDSKLRPSRIFLSLVKYGKPKGISCGHKIMPNQKGCRTAQFVALSWLNTMINLGLFGDAAGIRTVTGKDQLESTKLHCCRNDP